MNNPYESHRSAIITQTVIHCLFYVLFSVVLYVQIGVNEDLSGAVQGLKAEVEKDSGELAKENADLKYELAIYQYYAALKERELHTMYGMLRLDLVRSKRSVIESLRNRLYEVIIYSSTLQESVKKGSLPAGSLLTAYDGYCG